MNFNIGKKEIKKLNPDDYINIKNRVYNLKFIYFKFSKKIFLNHLYFYLNTINIF